MLNAFMKTLTHELITRHTSYNKHQPSECAGRLLVTECWVARLVVHGVAAAAAIATAVARWTGGGATTARTRLSRRSRPCLWLGLMAHVSTYDVCADERGGYMSGRGWLVHLSVGFGGAVSGCGGNTLGLGGGRGVLRNGTPDSGPE